MLSASFFPELCLATKKFTVSFVPKLGLFILCPRNASVRLRLLCQTCTTLGRPCAYPPPEPASRVSAIPRLLRRASPLENFFRVDNSPQDHLYACSPPSFSSSKMQLCRRIYSSFLSHCEFEAPDAPVPPRVDPALTHPHTSEPARRVSATPRLF